FVMAVKLNRGLRDSNYDQLYAYLKQHATHAKENKMMLERFSQPTVQGGRVVVQNVQGRQNRGQGMNPGVEMMLYMGELRIEQGMSIRVKQDQAQENGVALDVEQLLFLAGGHDNAFDDDVDEQPVQYLALNVDNAQENGVALDVEQLLFLADVDEAPTAQTMFMANLSSTDPVTDEAGPSYDSNILSEVQDHNQYIDDVCAHHEEHVMHDSVQLDHVVDSHADYTSDSNMISYDQYVKNNEVPVVHCNVSSVPNDAFMMIYNDMCEPPAQSVSNPSRSTVVKNSLTAELATYKEHVELYEQSAKFELTEREQKINEQLSRVISDRNFKEETLKRELHSIKLQLASTINHNKSMVKDKFIKQDQSLQTVHMLCRPRPNPNELNRVAIGYKNPLCLTRAKQVQPALYNGHEIIKDIHKPTIVHDTEDTLEIAEVTRKKMNDKMNDPECVTRKVKIAPHDYSKENFLATFTPQKQLTPEQIFWSNDLMKLKFEALKERTKALTKEVKEMKDVFEELEAKVAQFVIDRKRDAIELKNLLIENDNLIAECLFQEVFVNSYPNVSGSHPKSHIKPHRISPAKGVNKLPVEDQPRTNKSHLITSNRVDSSSRLKRTSIVATPSIRHNCNVVRKVKQVWKPKQVRQVWKPTRKVLTTIGHQWRPTGQILHLGKQCPLTRYTPPKVVSAVQHKKLASCPKHMTGDRSRLMNFVKKFIGTVRFGNDHFGAIMGYGDYVIGNSVISRVYYVEGLGHNLFSVEQFCDSDLEVAFGKYSCYVRDTDGVELIKGSRGSNLYTISIEDMMKSSPICLLSKASKNKSWLWHRRLNHLNFGTINDLARKDLVRGLPRLKFKKDYLCSACQLGKNKKHTHKPKAENTNLEVLHTSHMDLCCPI
nr:integrase, catalytic region, zinc finger, CCHC-type, peptidase aspartic, catalytic [Tanacetum cinerariifolium]